MMGPKELFGELSAEVCYDVKVEPDLLPLTGEQFDNKTAKVSQEVRSDVRVRGFFSERIFRVQDCISVRVELLEDEPSGFVRTCCASEENGIRAAYQSS